MARIKLEMIPAARNAGRYDVYIDDQKMESDMSQKIKEFTVTAGAHTVQIKVASNSSKQIFFEIDGSEKKSFGIGLSSGARTTRSIGVVVGLGIIIVGLMIGIGPGIPFGVLLLLPVIMIALGIVSYSQRNGYFTITELVDEDTPLSQA